MVAHTARPLGWSALSVLGPTNLSTTNTFRHDIDRLGIASEAGQELQPLLL